MTDTLTIEKEEQTQTTTSGGKYTCPMHSQIVRDAPGSCPICGMNLVQMQQ